jgi:zinc transport system ATP-binding protein
MALISCVDLSFGYEGKTLVSGLSFDVCEGDYLCVVGDNGAGKSTLLKTLLNLHKPLSGQIVTGEGFTRALIGFLPQQAEAQKDFPASVTEVVRSGFLSRRGLRPFYSAHEKKEAKENMERFGVAPLAKECFRELSGGQQRRVLLARALCAARKLLALDEPAAGLDPSAAPEMYDEIKKANDGGMAVIMVTHDIPAAIRYATKILRIDGQSGAFFGTVAEYLQSWKDRMPGAVDS